MRTDMDTLMGKRDLQAIIVTGGEYANTPRRYLSNNVDVHGGITIKKRGEAPVLIVSAMEKEEAAKSGLQVMTMTDLQWLEIYKEAQGDVKQALPKLWQRIFERLAIPAGKIGLYGVGDIGYYLEWARILEQALPDHQIVGEIGQDVFKEAFLTKDTDEFSVIREVAAGTNAVMQATWDFIAGHRAQGETVVKTDGSPLTIGEVKQFINRALLDRGLEGADMIFAQGRDAGFPHSRGEADDVLHLGKPIVFDLFPQQIGGGYFHDMTRTWCIGYAPAAVQAVYDDVMQAFQVALDAYAEPGQPTHLMQEAVLNYFESKGHPTNRSHPKSDEGYTHSLGHGVGLNIHEDPRMNHISKTDIFQQGNFITIEPGLYYPERGIGVRVEDSFLISADGKLESISPFRKDLVLPLKGG